MLLFLLHMLYRSICYQVSNQAEKLALLAIILYQSITMFQNMNEAYLSQNLFEFAFFLTAFVPVNLPTLTTQVLHLICSLFYILFVFYFTPYLHTI